MDENNSKILMIVDIQNLYYSVRDKFGYGSKIDYEKLLNNIKELRPDSSIYARAYLITQEANRDTGFVKILQHIGYTVYKKDFKVYENSVDVTGTSWTKEIILDTALDYNNFDEVIIVSCNGEYYELVRRLQSFGKKISLVCVAGQTSKKLELKVDTVIRIDNSFLLEK